MIVEDYFFTANSGITLCLTYASSPARHSSPTFMHDLLTAERSAWSADFQQRRLRRAIALIASIAMATKNLCASTAMLHSPTFCDHHQAGPFNQAVVSKWRLCKNASANEGRLTLCGRGGI